MSESRAPCERPLIPGKQSHNDFMKPLPRSLGTIALVGLSFVPIATHKLEAAAVGYITAVLRSPCADAPTPPPAVGGILVGTNFVIMTVADGDPADFQSAQQVVTDKVFQSLMPLYCALPRNASNCVSDSVQWGIITYDVNGNPLISGCAASGCQSHSCSGSEFGPIGYITALLRSPCADAPTQPPPVGGILVGTNFVIMTVANSDPTDFQAAQQVVTDKIFQSLMPLYCALPRNASNCVSDSVQWGIVTYDVNGNPLISGCAASGCQNHSCAGFESGPPVIVAEPSDQSVNSGQAVTLSVDASGVAPLSYQWVFNGTDVLNGATNAMLVLPSVQTNEAGTYQVKISNALGTTKSRLVTLLVNPGRAAAIGYITAVLRSTCADAPTPPPPVGGTLVGTNFVIMTVADADPIDFQSAQRVVTDKIFQSLMPLYCALPRNASNCVSDSVQWGIITYDVNGNQLISGCAASGCQSHSCAGSESGPVGYITAVLRSPCADAPTEPPQVGGILVGTNFVIMTVANADPTDFQSAQRVVTDKIFQSLMPLYCALPRNASNCVSDSVQWSIITYDAHGNPLISGCAASGCESHSCAAPKIQTVAPLLSISSVSTNAVLSWSAMASDFVLEGSSNLISWHPVNWPTASNLKSINAQMPANGNSLFFRLRRK
jgi:hypothetical protein